MRGTLVITRRELTSLFYSPLGWILLTLAVWLHGFVFTLMFRAIGGEVGQTFQAALGGNGYMFWALLLFLPPLLTMRLFADEARSGTLEYLLTAPVGDAAVVIGKFLAGTIFMAILWASTLLFALAFQMKGINVDWVPLLGSYVGAVCVSGLFIAIGLTVSSLVDSPLIAAFMSFIACLAWLLGPELGSTVLSYVASFIESPDLREGVLEAGGSFLGSINLIVHYTSSFARGQIDSAEIVFFLTWPVFFVFLAIRALEMRRWRG
jgi:ABC-2 type transport system permease protein